MLLVVGLVGMLYGLRGDSFVSEDSALATETESLSAEVALPSETASAKGAVIVDQLSLIYPNPTLIQTVTHMLEAADYTVSYVPHAAVTVDFFRTLPKRKDHLILLRSHGTAVSRSPSGELIEQAYTYLATGESVVPEKYPHELRKKWLTRFISDNPNEPEVFMLTEGFLKQGMKGLFNNSVVLMMGCDGMRNKATPELFIQRGAKAVVGWTDNVSVEQMDKGIEHLLQAYLVEGQSIALATHNTHQTIGVDPYFKAELRAVVRGE